jgi:carboxyl-terminal processing protease
VSRRLVLLHLLSAVVLLGMMVAGVRAQDWRAAALASFDDVWQTINDTFYDPTFGGLDWAAVRRDLRPRAEAATSPDQVRAVIRDMIATLKRSHFGLLTAASADALPGAASIAIDVRILADQAVVTRVTAGSAAAGAGFGPGQTLSSMDGMSVADLIRAAEGADARTRQLDAWRRVNRALHGAEGSTIAVSVIDGGTGRTRALSVARSIDAGEVVTLGNLPPLPVTFDARALATPRGRSVGVIAFNIWLTAVSERLDAAIDRFRTADGLILDLRGNPGGLAAMMNGLAGHLLSEPVVLGTMHTRQASLSFRANPRLVTADGRRVDPFRGPVAILVDELTGSASETFSGAMQSLGRARIFGRPTMGQALPASTKRLENGDVLMYAIGDFVTITGRSLEGDGVVPDELVPLSVAALAAGRDETVEAALRWVDGRTGGNAGRHPGDLP